jgi:hypothetical protein
MRRTCAWSKMVFDMYSKLLCAASESDCGSTVLLSIYLDSELILIDLPILCGPHGPHAVQLVPAQLKPQLPLSS